jgi:hypothetical protein
MNSYEALPDAPKDFLKQVPVTWDETRYITGIPGQYVVISRRKGNNWYLGGINGGADALEIIFDLPFVKKNATLNVITDGQDAGSFSTESIRTNGKDVKVRLLPRGGFVSTVEQ